MPATVAERDLGDGTHGTVHLPERRTVTTRAALVLADSEPQRLAAGRLLDGRPVTLEVRSRPTD